MSNRIETKHYLKRIYKKTDYENIMNNVFLTPIERKIIDSVYLHNASLQKISVELKLSESSIKRYQCFALDKIYNFLKEEKLIKKHI